MLCSFTHRIGTIEQLCAGPIFYLSAISNNYVNVINLFALCMKPLSNCIPEFNKGQCRIDDC